MKYYIIDCFTNVIGGGRPVAVCLLQEAASERSMQFTAKSLGLPETAFIIQKEKVWSLFCFSYESPVRFSLNCAMAASFVICSYVDVLEDIVTFETSEGRIPVIHFDDTYDVVLPEISHHEKISAISLSTLEIHEAYVVGNTLIAVTNENDITGYKPDYDEIEELIGDYSRLILISESDKFDFLLRPFSKVCRCEECSSESFLDLASVIFEIKKSSRIISRVCSERACTLYYNYTEREKTIGGHCTLFLECEK